jgi:hypothetical protein
MSAMRGTARGMAALPAQRETTWRTWLAWWVAASVVAFTVVHLVLWTMARSVPGAVDTRGRAGVSIAFAVVGALIITRRSDNAVGWLLCAIGFSFSLHGALDAYALYGVSYRSATNLPGATAAAWLVGCTRQVEVVLAFVFLPLLFPDGRPVSARWWPVAWLGGLGLLVLFVTQALRPGPVVASQVVVASNPLGVTDGARLLESIGAVAGWGLYLPSVLAAASVVIRFRRAEGIERQQLKWFVYGIVSIVGFDLLASTLLEVSHPSELVLDVIQSTIALGLPVAIGIAVLHHHLYDIDRLVNRTVVYGLLTVLLGLVYITVVLVLGQLLNPITGNSELTVAISTLSVAATFRPLRQRVQSLVDRRFNRHHYDAVRTIEVFSARLRNQVDLDSLSAELLAVVDKTVEPASASLWLRPVSSTHARAQDMPSLWEVRGPRQ